MRAKTVRCPECDQEFELEEGIGIGESTYCPECDAELKVVGLNPPMVETAEAPDDEFGDFENEESENDEDLDENF